MKVLFIDDDSDIAKMYKRALENRECFVKWCQSVREALEVARSKEVFPVVVIDVMMPWGPYSEHETNGGLITGERLYRDLVQYCPHAKYIVLTAYSQSQVPELLRSRVMVCSKGDYPPREFAKLVLSAGNGK